MDLTLTAAALLTECDSQGIRLWHAGNGRLKIGTPRHALTAELLSRLRANKSKLLAILPPPNEFDCWKERADPVRRRVVFYDPASHDGTPIWPDDELAARQLGCRATKPESADPPWPGWLADFVLLLDSDDLPEGLRLDAATVVTNRARCLASLRADISRGGSGPRAHVLLEELEQLRTAILRHDQVSSEEVVSASK